MAEDHERPLRRTKRERGLHKQRLLHDASCVLEFRDFLENYFSIQGADTLIILLLKESPEPGEKEFLIEGDFEK